MKIISIISLILFTSLLAAGCAPAEKKSFVSGTVSYRERLALPENAVVTVQIRDTSIMDASAPLIGEQVIETRGKQVPIAFQVGYDPAEIDPSRIYAISARITIDGKLRFTTDTSTRVITVDHPTQGLDLMLVAVK